MHISVWDKLHPMFTSSSSSEGEESLSMINDDDVSDDDGMNNNVTEHSSSFVAVAGGGEDRSLMRCSNNSESLKGASTISALKTETHKVDDVPPPSQVSLSSQMAKYIGKRVAKTFDDEQGEPLGLFRGIVMRHIDKVDNNDVFLVTYDDGDSENVGRKELHEMLELFKEVGEEIKFKSKKAYRHEIHRRAKDYYYQIMVHQNKSSSSCPTIVGSISTATSAAISNSVSNNTIPPTLKSKLWNIKVRTNIYCHLCQTMKPLGGIFPCNASNHSYCDFHLKTRLGVDLCPSANQTLKHIQYCPICCVTCSCTLCSRRLDNSACQLEECNLKKRPFQIKDWAHDAQTNHGKSSNYVHDDAKPYNNNNDDNDYGPSKKKQKKHQSIMTKNKSDKIDKNNISSNILTKFSNEPTKINQLNLKGIWKQHTKYPPGIEIINRTIRIYYEGNQEYFVADVCKYDEKTGKHLVIYKTDTEEIWEKLYNEHWMILHQDQDKPISNNTNSEVVMQKNKSQTTKTNSNATMSETLTKANAHNNNNYKNSNSATTSILKNKKIQDEIKIKHEKDNLQKKVKHQHIPNNQLNLLSDVIDQTMMNASLPSPQLQHTNAQLVSTSKNSMLLSSSSGDAKIASLSIIKTNDKLVSEQLSNDQLFSTAKSHNAVTKSNDSSNNNMSSETTPATTVISIESSSSKIASLISMHDVAKANDCVHKQNNTTTTTTTTANADIKGKANDLALAVRGCLDKQYHNLYKGRNVTWKYDARCHLCHARRDKVLVFNCGVHFFCLKHLQERFHVKAKDIPNDAPCCPLCTLFCDCAKCIRHFANLTEYAKKHHRPLLSLNNNNNDNANYYDDRDNQLSHLLMKSSFYPRTLKEAEHFNSDKTKTASSKEVKIKVKKKRSTKNAANKLFPDDVISNNDYNTTTALSSPSFSDWSSPPPSASIQTATFGSQSSSSVINNRRTVQLQSTNVAAPTPAPTTNSSRLKKYNKKCKEFEKIFFYFLSNVNLPSIAILSSFVCLGVEGQRGRQFYKFMRSSMGSSESVFVFTLCFYSVFYNFFPANINNKNNNCNDNNNNILSKIHSDYFEYLGTCLSVQNIVAPDAYLIRNFFKDVKKATSDTFQLDQPPTVETMTRNIDEWISVISNYEYRFFADLANYGTDCIITLASHTTYADGSHVRRFYGLLKGEKTDTKYAIMNQCLCAVLLRWIKYDAGKPCMDFSTFWEICLILSSCFMCNGLPFSIVRDFFDTTPGNFGTLVQKTYQRYHHGGFIKSTSVPYKYSILEHNKKQSSLGLNDEFVQRHKLQTEQTFTSSTIPLSPSTSSNTMEEVAEVISLRSENQKLSTKVTSLELEVSQLKASSSLLRAQLLTATTTDNEKHET